MKFRKQKPQEERRRPPTTVNPGVFSYYARNNTAPAVSPEAVGRHVEKPSLIKRLNLRVGYLPSYIMLFVLLGALGYSLWLQPVPRINVLSQSGTIYRDGQEYQDGIEDIWRSNLLNQTKLTVRNKQLRTDILNRFSELADVQIELPLLGRRPAITLTPATPAMQLVSGNGVFYVSSTGRIMAKTTDVKQNQLAALPLVRDEGGLEAEAGKVVIPEPQAQFLTRLFAQLTDAKIPIQSVTLPSTAANQADIRLTDKPYYIKFSMDSDPRQAVGTYLAVRDRLAAEGVTPEQYIDVRVEEKAFYQ